MIDTHNECLLLLSVWSVVTIHYKVLQTTSITYLLQRHVFAIKTAFETTNYSPHIIMMMMETEMERLSMASRDFIPQK